MAGTLVDLPQFITAVGGLGTAAYGLVDVSKVARGGPSNHGFQFVRRLLRERLFAGVDTGAGLGVRDLERMLHAHWINGTALEEQKAQARTLVKLAMGPATVPALAKATGVDAEQLAADLKAGSGDALTRFEAVSGALLDEAYLRADQRYRNCSRGWAMLVSVVLGVLGAWVLREKGPVPLWASEDLWTGLLAGLLGAPLAPIAKDVSSAIAAGMQVAQMKRR